MNIWEYISKMVNKQRGKRGWHMLATALAFVLVFGVTYSLILPAITLEENVAMEDPAIHLEAEEVPAAEEAPAAEEPQPEAAQQEEAQPEEPQPEAPQTEAPQSEAPQTEAPQTEAPQTEASQSEEPKQQDPAAAAAEEPQVTEAADTESRADETDAETQASTETEEATEEQTQAAVFKEFTWEEKDSQGRKLTVKITPDKEITGWPADTELKVRRVTESDEKTRELYKACLAEGKKQEGKEEELELSDFTAWTFAFVSGEDEFVLDSAAKVEVTFREPVSADEDRSGRVLLYQQPGRDKKTSEPKTDYDVTEDKKIKGFKFHTESLRCDGVIFEIVLPDTEEEESEEIGEAATEDAAEEETEEETEELDEAVTEEVTEEETEELYEAVTEEVTEEETEEISEADTEEATEAHLSGPVMFEAQTQDVTVSVYAPAGAFPEGTTMEVAPAEAEEYAEAVEKAVEDGVEVSRMLAVDIIFRDADGNEIEPACPVSVKMRSELIREEEEPVIVHVDDEGTASLVSDASLNEDDEMLFHSDEFSVYLIVGTRPAVLNADEPVSAVIKLLAIGDTQTTNTLDGVAFELYSTWKGTDDPENVKAKNASDEEVGTITTGPDGKAEIGELLAGTYYLVETRAHDGYKMPTEPVKIYITEIEEDPGYTVSYMQKGYTASADAGQLKADDEGAYLITVSNPSGIELPMTGGSGTLRYTLGGLLLIIAAAWMYVSGMRRRVNG